MTSAGLHRGLQEPWEHCQQIRGRLLAVVEPVPAADWERRGPASGWSLAEQVDHLFRAEVGTSKVARRLIRGTFGDLKRPSEARLFDSSLGTYPFPPGQAPEGLVPAPAGGKDALLAALAQAHARFAAELGRFEGPDADALLAPDGDSGLWFTLGGWVRLQALHEEHHLEQIRRMLPS